MGFLLVVQFLLLYYNTAAEDGVTWTAWKIQEIAVDSTT